MDALRQALAFQGFDIARYYVIDAICIDQGSAQEKNGQVAIMGEIFSRAELVLACLGSPDKWTCEFERLVERSPKPSSAVLESLQTGVCRFPMSSWTCFPEIYHLSYGRSLHWVKSARELRPYLNSWQICQETPWPFHET